MCQKHTADSHTHTHTYTYTQFALLFYALKAIDDTSMMYMTISSVLFVLSIARSLSLSPSASFIVALLVLLAHLLVTRWIYAVQKRICREVATHTHTRTHRGALSRFFGKLYQLIQFLLFYPTSMRIKIKYWHWNGYGGKRLDSIWALSKSGSFLEVQTIFVNFR